MPVSDEASLIPYDRMKEQVEKDLSSFLERSRSLNEISLPGISFERGGTKISFSFHAMNEGVLIDCMTLIKKHIANVRIHNFEDGFFSFQALNKNLFNSENVLDNFKIDFFSLSTSTKAEISKKGNLTQEEINFAIEIFKRIYSSTQDDPVVRLKKLGASIVTAGEDMGWDYIAGYEEVKRKIRESIILPLKNPDVYDSIASMTRKVFESNRPHAILFEGPPGVGKTTVARIISGEVNIPLIYVPIESIMSKWYGQSSQNLSQIFDACEDLGGGILFLDEIDSLAGSRDQNMFEATRRILSVLLRRLDGIDAAAKTLTIGATNRKGDLDNALISRFDQTITFPLPNEEERAAILSNYARHLSMEECLGLAKRCEGISGRNVKDICEMTERKWARKVVTKNMEPSPPPVEYYRHSLKLWMNPA